MADRGAADAEPRVPPIVESIVTVNSCGVVGVSKVSIEQDGGHNQSKRKSDQEQRGVGWPETDLRMTKTTEMRLCFLEPRDTGGVGERVQRKKKKKNGGVEVWGRRGGPRPGETGKGNKRAGDDERGRSSGEGERVWRG